MYKLIYKEEFVSHIDEAFGKVEFQNVFTSDYDEYRIIIEGLGNQSSNIWYLMPYNSSGRITTGLYSEMEIWKSDTAYTEIDAGNTSLGWLNYSVKHNTSTQSGFAIVDVYYPADTGMMTIWRVNSSGTGEDGVRMTGGIGGIADQTLQANTGFAIQSYGIGEDVINMNVSIYGATN